MIKTIENCLTCKYGANGHYCNALNCHKCKLYDGSGGCNCVKVQWGKECVNYEPRKK